VVAVHAFNNQPASSSDFGFNAQLYTYVVAPSTIPPVVAAVVPPSGAVLALSNLTVAFSEPVTNVEAADLLVNGVPATGLTSTTNTTYTFSFTQPGFGPVAVTWAAGHGIQDFDNPPKPFDGTAAGATFNYSLVNPNAPTVASQSPLAGATVNTLTQVAVSFSEAVTGVDATDLRINGVPRSRSAAAPWITSSPSRNQLTAPFPSAGPQAPASPTRSRSTMPSTARAQAIPGLTPWWTRLPPRCFRKAPPLARKSPTSRRSRCRSPSR